MMTTSKTGRNPRRRTRSTCGVGPRLIRRAAAALVVAAAGSLLAGCYERVVSTEDPNFDGDVWDSNLEESRVPVLDDALDALEGKDESGR